jgi:isoleucyl-tRNA synthetase
MPFISEEIWQRIKAQAGVSGETIMLQAWPVANESRIDAAAEGDIEWVKQLMLGRAADPWRDENLHGQAHRHHPAERQTPKICAASPTTRRC